MANKLCKVEGGATHLTYKHASHIMYSTHQRLYWVKDYTELVTLVIKCMGQFMSHHNTNATKIQGSTREEIKVLLKILSHSQSMGKTIQWPCGKGVAATTCIYNLTLFTSLNYNADTLKSKQYICFEQKSADSNLASYLPSHCNAPVTHAFEIIAFCLFCFTTFH